MGNELCSHLLCVNIPYGTGGINRRRPEDTGIGLVPIKGRQGGTILRRFVVIQQRFLFYIHGPYTRSIVCTVPQPQVIASCCQQIFGTMSHIVGPHEFCARIRMIEGSSLVEGSLVRRWILFDDGYDV